ncbi:gag-pol [Trichonephila clavipes]|nr:gag-pol [Trichonephila clavipes]
MCSHRKGSAEGNVDAPSRRPCRGNSKYNSRVKKKFGMISPVVRQVPTPLTSESDLRNDEIVRKDQLADPEIKLIIEFKKSSDEKPSWHRPFLSYNEALPSSLRLSPSQK